MSDDKRHKTEMDTDQAVVAEAAGVPKSQVSLPVELQGAIGKQLKHVYGQMLAEPMPDKFAKLLESLSKSEPHS